MNMTEKYFRSIIRESLMTISKENKALNEGKFTNALATGLLGLATLGPMTSCEKNEPGIDKNKIETTNNKNKGSEENDKQPVIDLGGVSENGVLNCGLKDFDGEVEPNKQNIGHYDDDAYIIIELDNNNGVTTLMLDLYTPNDVNYCITFEDNGNNNLTPVEITRDGGSKRVRLSDKQNVINIFSKYHIEDEVYDKIGINPTKLSLELKDDLFVNGK